uniref:TetR family transcriptional regulator C-terminal domain-containing protein n=1 Tax=Saccharothrix mutabilis TaxID=33921 RepID=UPI0031E3F194
MGRASGCTPLAARSPTPANAPATTQPHVRSSQVHARQAAHPDPGQHHRRRQRLAALLDGLAVNAVLQPDLMIPAKMRAVLRRHLDGLAASRR